MIHPTRTVCCHHGYVWPGIQTDGKYSCLPSRCQQGAWLKAWVQQLLLLWSISYYSGSSALLRTWGRDLAHFSWFLFRRRCRIFNEPLWLGLKLDLWNGTLGQCFILFKRLDKRLFQINHLRFSFSMTSKKHLEVFCQLILL